ncbi:zinc ribbon domain-containing protein [Coleofasciculus sp. FACHB-SPT9]|uniref:zinc ribbon domain-containing protein n=1 Tax=Cyanophyceae TaxID=3028117 RepID=UPI0016875463|nr:zinc ribbon domain-containing protein [Coleofasciculus sp. FACHB-SPT9]MBD1892159.1 zinc ribbon domain-containing protein [Coleofasciculus sp. FACHB-SPT9]
MSENSQVLELLQAARCEDLVYTQIPQLTVLGNFERKVVDTVKGGGAHLLEGSRGVGKSMLLRQAEFEMDRDFTIHRKLAVYVTFQTSTLLEGIKVGERDAFQSWVGAKILEKLHEKLLFLDLISHQSVIDPYEAMFGIKSPKETKIYLQEKAHQLQNLAMAVNKEEIIAKIGNDFFDKVNDLGYVMETLKEIIAKFDLQKIVFLFDEAAHTFIPRQQEIFFEIFKRIHGGSIAVKAAVYPSITSYGKNFEPEQDAIAIPMDRFDHTIEGRQAIRENFRDMLKKRIDSDNSLCKKIFSKGQTLDICIYLSTGNPRAFLHILNRTLEKAQQLKEGFSERAVRLAVQDFIDKELIPYHQNLSKRIPKFSHHVGVGMDLLRSYIIPELRSKNHRQKQNNYQSAFFTVRRDMSPNLKLALNILCYSGVLTNKGTIAVSDKKTGFRYMVHLALLVTEKAFLMPDLAEAIKVLSIRYSKEFAGDDPQFESYLRALKEASDQCANCSADLPPNAKFCPECGQKVQATSIISGLLEESIDALSISGKLKDRIRQQFPKIGDIVQAKRTQLMAIRLIGEVRSRIIKNAADEFISG